VTGKFIELHACIRKRRLSINNLRPHLENPGEEEPNTPMQAEEKW
jgi:hypothetical protein